MTFSKIGRIVTALVATAALGLGMTACGGGTIGYMWVLGTYYNQVSGFKIDDFTGNLTAIDHSPFASGGSNPQSIVVKSGGRFVYVLNSGVCGTSMAPVPCLAPGAKGYVPPSGSGIALYSVGGGGTLTFLQNFFGQGTQPVWLSFDSTGNFLYEVDKYAPGYDATSYPFGAVTAYSVAADTGRLTLVPNTSILNANGTPTNYFVVGGNPVMAKVGGGSCLFTLSPTSIYPYSINASTGQLTVATTGPYSVQGASNLTSINTANSSFTYLTDAGTNQIFSLQAGGTTCSLTPIGASQQANLNGTGSPMNSLTSTSGKFLYVLNQSSGTGTQTNTNSSVSAFTINATGQLATLADSTNNPYAVGSGPVCVAQDPTNQYLYTSNNVDSTVTGKLLDQNRGFLADLTRGSVFPVTMRPTCLAVSGNI